MREVLRALACMLLAAVARADEARFSFERGLMGTRFEIICFGADGAAAKAAADEAFEVAEEINAVASDYIADSELLRLSKMPAGEPVEVSPGLFDLLARSMELAEKTGGSFDPTLGPMTRLWRESRRVGKLPSPEALDAAKSACGWRSLELDATRSTVTLGRDGMRLDLGGIAKGRAADLMFDVMKSKGFPSTCIAAGGDLRLGDPPPGKAGWAVGVRTSDKSRNSGQLELSNGAVSTSGDLQQFVEIDGARYAHIVDPETGLGLTNPIAVTVVADNATLSDALATAACVAGAENARPLALRCGAREVRIAGELRVMTWNLHHGVGEDGVLDLERIAAVIRREDPDLVALQEMDRGCRRSGGVDQAAELARLTGLHGVFGAAMDFDGGQYGQAILSRHPVDRTEVHRLPGGGEPRIALEAEFAADGRPLRFVSVHLDAADGMIREKQAAVLDRVLGEAGTPVALCGDFNDVPDSATMRSFGDWLPVMKSQPVMTCPGDDPTVEIDHVLVRGFTPTGTARVLPEAVASDHRPVISTLIPTP